MSYNTVTNLPWKYILDNFPCLLSVVPTKLKTPFLCALAVSWDNDFWVHVPPHLIEDTLALMPYMVDNSFGKWYVHDDRHLIKTWTREDIKDSNGKRVKYEHPYNEPKTEYKQNSGCTFCCAETEDFYEKEEYETLIGKKICEDCYSEYI